MLPGSTSSVVRTVATRGGRQLKGLRLRRKPDPTRVTWNDIRALKERAIQEGNYNLFEMASKALHIGMKHNRFYRECEFEIRRKRIREANAR